jgi:hypothetical protein
MKLPVFPPPYTSELVRDLLLHTFTTINPAE